MRASKQPLHSDVRDIPMTLNTSKAGHTTQVDALGLLCPLPILRARKVLIGLDPGAVLRLLADDPMAVIDVPHYCTQAGHELLSAADGAQGQEYLIRRGPLPR